VAPNAGCKYAQGKVDYTSTTVTAHSWWRSTASGTCDPSNNIEQWKLRSTAIYNDTTGVRVYLYESGVWRTNCEIVNNTSPPYAWVVNPNVSKPSNPSSHFWWQHALPGLDFYPYVEMGLLTHRRTLRTAATVISVFLVVSAAFVLTQAETAGARSGTWPISLKYELRYKQTPDLAIPLATATFEFQGESWSSWRNVQVSGPDQGYTMEVHPDGAVLAGYPSWPNLEEIDKQSPGNEVVPLSDFAGVADFVSRTGGSPDAIAQVAGATIEDEAAGATAVRLGIQRSDLVGYEVTTSDIAGTAITTSYVVHLPTGIPLEITEYAGAPQTRSLVVTSMEFLTTTSP
jgi:hypothetical protein